MALITINVMWTPLLFNLDIGGRRGNAYEKEEMLTNDLQKRHLTNEFEFYVVLSVNLYSGT